MSKLDRGYIIEIIYKRQNVPKADIYPHNLAVLQNLAVLPLHRNVTFIVGENGSGKSTLIEAMALAYGFNAEGGTLNFCFSTRSTTADLYKYLTLVKAPKRARDGFFLRAESFYNVATNIDELDEEPADAPLIIDSYGGRSLHEQSHGESFMALFINRFSGNGLYILDEPEASLSPEKQLAFVTRIHQLVQLNSQFIIATHSPIISAYPDALIYQISSDGPVPVAYEDSEPCRFMRFFADSYPRIMREIMMPNKDLFEE